MFSIEKVDHFPEITRNGRASEELNMIIEALNQSASTGDRFCIPNVEKGKQYNSVQQRLRSQAKKLGLNIVIRHDSVENRLYFKTSHAGNVKISTEEIAKQVAAEQQEVEPKKSTRSTSK
jgi:hypothetical protein